MKSLKGEPLSSLLNKWYSSSFKLLSHSGDADSKVKADNSVEFQENRFLIWAADLKEAQINAKITYAQRLGRRTTYSSTYFEKASPH